MNKHLALIGAAAFALVLGAMASPAAAEVFRASLSGDAEIPSVSTSARGTAIFRTDDGGATLHYRIIVSNLMDATQSHIHVAPADENGPVVAFLFGLVPEGISKNGVLAEGVITESDLIARDGFDATMESLLDRLRSGGAYVNVHTLAYPPGEIRGQIQASR